MKKFLSTIFFTIFFILLAPTLYAVGTPELPQGVSVEPAFQEIEIKANDTTVEGNIIITNAADFDQTLTVTALDINQTDANGNINFIDKPDSSNPFRIADFIAFKNTDRTVPAHTSKEIPFVINNTQELSPGGHYGAIISRFESSAKSGTQQVLPALSSFVLIRKIGGERYQLSLRSVHGVPAISLQIPQKIELLFENNGNIHTTPYGTLKIIDIFSKLRYKGSINEGSLIVLPQTQRQIENTVQSLGLSWPLMIYTLQIQGMSRPGDVPFFTEVSFLYISPFMCLGLLIGLGLLGFYFYKRHTKQHEKEE
ncbi:hypothetical protein KA082_02105 [Candidatus Woesebacteria bacterium]|nr:hypothetical protein [Candidatus Woesebacteria bacterium]